MLRGAAGGTGCAWLRQSCCCNATHVTCSSRSASSRFVHMAGQPSHLATARCIPLLVLSSPCSAEDFYKILTEPESNMIKQQQALLGTENVELIFTGGRGGGGGGGD